MTTLSRIAFHQRDKAVVEEALVLQAQPPAGGRVSLKSCAKAPVEKNGARVVRSAASQAEVAFHRHV